MAFDPNRWTLKTQEAFTAATTLAKTKNNPEITPAHLLSAMVSQSEGIVLPMLDHLGESPLSVRNRIDNEIASLPAAYGSEARISQIGRAHV